jgi:hypothetical protein
VDFRIGSKTETGLQAGAGNDSVANTFSSLECLGQDNRVMVEKEGLPKIFESRPKQIPVKSMSIVPVEASKVDASQIWQTII